MAEKAKISPEASKVFEGVKVVRAFVEKRQTAYVSKIAATTEGMEAANAATSCKADLTNLDRIIKRFEAGFYN